MDFYFRLSIQLPLFICSDLRRPNRCPVAKMAIRLIHILDRFLILSQLVKPSLELQAKETTSSEAYWKSRY